MTESLNQLRKEKSLDEMSKMELWEVVKKRWNVYKNTNQHCDLEKYWEALSLLREKFGK